MKVLGAVLICVCCGWFGFSLSSAHKREERNLKQLIASLEYMQCEIQYRLLTLPELCLQASSVCEKGPVRDFWVAFKQELDQQLTAEVQPCLLAALDHTPQMTGITRECLLSIGKDLGIFDMDGQISALESSEIYCKERLENHCAGKDEQRRSYQTLGICAGAALVIILI